MPTSRSFPAPAAAPLAAGTTVSTTVSTTVRPTDNTSNSTTASLATTTAADSFPGSLPLYGLDIETDTTTDGLDPVVASVVAAAVSGPGADRVLTGPEPDLLAALDRHLAGLTPGIVVTWNGSGFDLPFLSERARRTGVRLGLRTVPEDPPTPALRGDRTAAGSDRESTARAVTRVRAAWGSHLHLDGYRIYRADVGRGLGLSCGLKALARLVGLDPVEVDREGVHDLDEELLRDYVMSDARLARSLVLRRWPAAAPWVDRIPVPGHGPPPATDSVTAR